MSYFISSPWHRRHFETAVNQASAPVTKPVAVPQAKVPFVDVPAVKIPRVDVPPVKVPRLDTPMPDVKVPSVATKPAVAQSIAARQVLESLDDTVLGAPPVKQGAFNRQKTGKAPVVKIKNNRKVQIPRPSRPS